MAPDAADRIRAMLRALEDVVIPAINPDDGPAVQQAMQCVINLRMLESQQGRAYHVAIRELQIYAGLLADLASVAGDALEPALRDALAAAGGHPLNGFVAPAMDEIEQTTRAYRELADAVLESPELKARPALKHRVALAVVARSGEETDLRRAWTRQAGLEADDVVLDLDAMIAPAVAPAQRR